MWFSVFCVLAGLIYAGILYFKEKKFEDQAAWKVWGLAFMRFVTVTCISFLLLGILMRINKDETKNPTIVMIEDASTSIKNSEDQQLMKDLKSNLEADFQLESYHFSGEIEEGLADTIDGQTTNISQVFEFIDETYANQNLGAVIMSTDGIFNEGQNPIYQKSNITSPFYFIAQGDTTQKKDIQIKQVYHNRIAYLQDKFIVQADVQAYNFNNTNTTVSIYQIKNGQRTLIEKEPLQINNNSFFKTIEFEVPAEQVGVVKYIVEVSGRNGEYSKSNNFREFFVDVLDARQKILIYANAPHPDLAAIKNIVNTNKNYEVKTVLAKAGESNLAVYDLVIFHNLPSDKNSINSQLDQLNKLRKPRLFVAGTQISIPAFNQAQSVVKITANTSSINEVQASVKNDFKLFEQSQELKKIVSSFPPMLSKFGEFTADPTANVLLTQKIGDVVTEYPLLAVKNQSGLREGVITGEGMWQWRLFNYLQTNNFDLVNELLTKTINYITIKEDKRKFRVSSSENIYKTYDRVGFDAELYNESYEKINDVDAFLVVKNESNIEFQYTFSKIADFYQIDAGTLPAGNYSYTGTTNYSGKTLKASGKFSVQEVQLEQANTTADHNLLKGLNERYGGAIFYERSVEDIVAKIKADNQLKPIIYSASKTESALNLKWILFALMFLLFLEWFVRRLLGSY